MINIQHLALRFLIVSRPESHLCEAFEEPALANVTEMLSLYGDFGAPDDISMYLQSEFSRIYNSKRHSDAMELIPRPWPSEDIIERLVRKSGGYFIYASTVIKFIDEEYFLPTARLDRVLGISNSFILVSESNPFAELDQLYIQILSSYPTSQLPVLKHILGHLVVSYVRNTMYFTSIEDFLGLPQGQMKATLRGLRSLVSFNRWSDPVLIHASFGDFILDEARAGKYYIDSEEWVLTTFRRTFSLWSGSLCRSSEHRNCASQVLKGPFLILI